MLKIDTIYKKGILFVRLYGVINKTTKLEIEKTLESAISKVGIKYLLLNFDNIYYISSDITKIIGKWSQNIIKNGGKFFICGYDKIQKKYSIDVSKSVFEMKDEISVFNMIKI